MSAIRVVVRIAIVALLVVTGTYVLVYLYRWEWHRALIAGVFFLAAELALIGMVLADRLHDASFGATGPPAPRERAAGAPRFPWLDPGRFSVFVPVLLGAGALLSVGAYVLERLARATAPAGPSPLLTRLVANSPVAVTVPAATRKAHGHRLLAVAAVGAASIVAAVALQVLADATQARHQPPRAGWVTTIELDIHQRRPWSTTEDLARLLALRCVPDELRTTVRLGGGTRAVLDVSPAPVGSEERKIVGCLGDASLDRVLVDVVAITSAPGA